MDVAQRLFPNRRQPQLGHSLKVIREKFRFKSRLVLRTNVWNGHAMSFPFLQCTQLTLIEQFFLQVKTFIDLEESLNMEAILICHDTWAGKSKVVYNVVASVAQFFVPVILVISLYLAIYLKLKNRPQVSIQWISLGIYRSHCWRFGLSVK